MIDVDRPQEILNYGDTPYFHGSPFPSILRWNELGNEDLRNIGNIIFDWITSDRDHYGATFAEAVTRRFDHPYPVGRDELHGVRLLVMAQFFMRHPQHESSSRGIFFHRVFYFFLHFLSGKKSTFF